MHRNAPIIIVEDNADDRDLLRDIFNELPYKNKIVFLNDGVEAFEYLMGPGISPFIIISDINMPRMNGVELRDKVQSEGSARLKGIPYLFLTTGSSAITMSTVYDKGVQGCFVKNTNFKSFKLTVQHIMEYWNDCARPAS